LDVIEFPFVFEKWLAWRGFPGRPVDRVSQPALVVDAAVAEDLEILCLAPILRLGIRKRIQQAYAFDGSLRRAVHRFGLGQAGRFENGRRDVYDVVPLRPQLALGFDLVRPVNDHAVARAAVAAGDLLGPGEGRVPRHGPTGRVVT